jgi:hypothetical protein
MAITTVEFEGGLEQLLELISGWAGCAWCGDHLRNVRPGSSLCETCKRWKRREQQAIEEQDAKPSVGRTLHLQYEIEFARLCREEGQIKGWEGPVLPLNLELELQTLSERFFGEDVFRGTILYFQQFSPAQRRLLMYLLRRMTKVWLRHRRRGFAREAAHEKIFPPKS